MSVKMIAAILIVLFVLFGYFYQRYRYFDFFNKRPRMAFDEMYSKYFYNTKYEKKILEELWVELCISLKVDPMLLRPDDDFSERLSGVKWTHFIDPMEEMESLLRNKAKLYGVDYVDSHLKTMFNSINTVFDYILIEADFVEGYKMKEVDTSR